MIGIYLSTVGTRAYSSSPPRFITAGNKYITATTAPKKITQWVICAVLRPGDHTVIRRNRRIDRSRASEWIHDVIPHGRTVPYDWMTPPSPIANHPTNGG